MNTERWEQIEAVFQAAVECDPLTRSRLLDDSCGADRDLRLEVDALLNSLDKSENFLFEGIQREAECLTATHTAEAIGRRVGLYRLTALLGRGGMGAVYLAARDDDAYQKQVAIKLIRRGMDTDDVLRRFRIERQILAQLDHPNIARLVDGGATEDGLPYLVMEYVEGSPITEFCKLRAYSLPEKLKLFRAVCDAVQYAHAHLVVHLDLKPQNILVSPQGIPKLLDFGVAKLLTEDGPARTVAAMRMLTPHYASPEQVEGAPVTTAADVYSLGILLYEIVTNSAPYRLTGLSSSAIEQAIREQIPRPPSELALTPGELDTIVLKAIQKEPGRRYISVEQFGEDIRRYLEGLPVIARRDTVIYRASKFIRRNRWAVAGASIAAIGLIAGIVLANVQARRAERRFEQVQGLTNLVIHDLGRDLQSIPGTLSIQQRLVPKTLATLEALVRDSGDNPSLRADLAMGYYRMANIQYSLDKPNTAEIEAATDNLRRALALLEPLLAKDAGNCLLRGDLGRVYLQLGWCLRGMGEYEEALAAHLKAQPLLKSAEPFSEPNWPKFPSALNRYDIAASLTSLGRFREALTFLPNAALGNKEIGMVGVLKGQGDLHAAAKRAQELRNPKQFAGFAQLILGDLLGNPLQLNLGDPVAGIRLVRAAVELRERYAASDSMNVFARLNTSPALLSLAEFTRESEPQQSVDAYLKAIAIEDEQLKVSPHNRDARRAIARARAEMALPLSKLGRTGEAEASLQAAANLERKLAEPRSFTELEWGDWFLRTGRRADALDHYQRAVTLANEAIERRPEQMQIRRELADCFERLGAYYAAAGDERSAHEWYVKSLDLWTNWTKWGVSSDYNRRRERTAKAAVKLYEKKVSQN